MLEAEIEITMTDRQSLVQKLCLPISTTGKYLEVRVFYQLEKKRIGLKWLVLSDHKFKNYWSI